MQVSNPILLEYLLAAHASKPGGQPPTVCSSCFSYSFGLRPLRGWGQGEGYLVQVTLVGPLSLAVLDLA